MKKRLTKQTTTRRPLWGLGGLFLLFPLWGLVGFFGGWGLSAQSHVTVNPETGIYAVNDAFVQTVTFSISWDEIPNDGKTHLSKVWAWVEYIPVVHYQLVGDWQRATIAAVTSGTVAAGGTGFWLQGNDGAFGEVVTATLFGMPDQFNWCVHVSDALPGAVQQPDGSYVLNGTPPFTINGNITVEDYSFAAGTCISSLSDATGNPEYVIIADVLTVATTNPDTLCSPGEVTLTATVCGTTNPNLTYTWIVDGGAAQITNTNSFLFTAQDVGGYTYSVSATDAAAGASATAYGTITVKVPETLVYLASPAEPAQTITAGAAITPIVYTTNNSASYTITGLPAGLSATWNEGTCTISGIPAVARTYTYTVTAIDECGYEVADERGLIKVNPECNCAGPNMTLSGVAFISDATYARNGLELSAPVRVTTCSFIDSNDNGITGKKPSCINHSCNKGTQMDECLVRFFGAVLCPTPWRVPTIQDLSMWLTGDENSKNGDASVTCATVGGCSGYYRYAGFCEKTERLQAATCFTYKYYPVILPSSAGTRNMEANTAGGINTLRCIRSTE